MRKACYADIETYQSTIEEDVSETVEKPGRLRAHGLFADVRIGYISWWPGIVSRLMETAMNETTNAQPQPRDDNWIPACFGPNQQKLRPLDPLLYAGKHIAWSWDGTHIVASADSY